MIVNIIAKAKAEKQTRAKRPEKGEIHEMEIKKAVVVCNIPSVIEYKLS